MARRSKPPSFDDPIPTFEEAEKTQITSVPVFDDDLEPAGPTDKNFVPRADAPKKLRLPIPDEPDPEPPPNPPRKSEPDSPLSGAKLEPDLLPGRPVQPVKLYAPEPSGISKWFVGGAALLLTVVAVAFAMVPDGKSKEELAEARREIMKREPGASIAKLQKDYPELFGPNTPQISVPAAVKTAPPKKIPPLNRDRKKVEAARRRKLAPKSDHPYGLEGTVQPKREYDNYDASKPKGTGYPTLMVTTRPTGVLVELDGMIVGLTPLVRVLPQGTTRAQVKLSGAGLKDWSGVATPNDLDQFQIGITMERLEKTAH